MLLVSDVTRKQFDRKTKKLLLSLQLKLTGFTDGPDRRFRLQNSELSITRRTADPEAPTPVRLQNSASASSKRSNVHFTQFRSAATFCTEICSESRKVQSGNENLSHKDHCGSADAPGGAASDCTTGSPQVCSPVRPYGGSREPKTRPRSAGLWLGAGFWWFVFG